MKKFFSLVLVVVSLAAQAQNLDAINDMLGKNQYPAAKAAIDKHLANPKNQKDGQAWFLKGTIYNNYSNDTALAALTAYDYKVQALEAYKKSQEVDKLELMMKTQMYRPYLFVYSGFFNLGAQQFNQKDYAGAYNSFSKADEVRSLILARKYAYDEYKFHAVDTNLTLNMAAAAINAKNTDNAAKAYRTLADAGLSGKDYEEIYQYLVDYYSTKSDAANMEKYMQLGRAKYPQSAFWSSYELDKLSQGTDKKALFDKYEEIYLRNPSDYNTVYNYAAEMYNSIYKDMNYPDSAAGKDKLTAVLKAAIAADKEIEATVVMTNHLFNHAAEYSSKAVQTKGTKPEDVKRRKELNALANAKMDEMIPYAQSVIRYYTTNPPTKTAQKMTLRNTYGYMVDIYDVKGDKKKSDEFQGLKDGVKF